MVRTLFLGLAASLLFCGTSNANFVFNLRPASPTVAIGSSVDVGLFVRATGRDVGKPINFFFAALNERGDSDITTNSPLLFIGSTGSVSRRPTQVGSFSVDASLFASPGDKKRFSGIVAYHAGFGLRGLGISPVSTTVTAVAEPAAIPEPTSLLMFGSLVGLGLVRRRR